MAKGNSSVELSDNWSLGHRSTYIGLSSQRTCALYFGRKSGTAGRVVGELGIEEFRVPFARVTVAENGPLEDFMKRLVGRVWPNSFPSVILVSI